MFATIARSETCFSDTEIILIDDTFIGYDACKDNLAKTSNLKTQNEAQATRIEDLEKRYDRNQKQWMKSVVIGILGAILIL